MPETFAVYYFDELRIGQQFVSGTHTIDEAQIVEFARAYDPQLFHLDREAARHSPFGELVASGWHTAAIMMRLLVDGGAPIGGGILGVGGEIKWLKPTRPGDTLQVFSEIVEMVPSKSRPDRGIVSVRSETRNDRGDVLQTFVSKLIVPRRPAQA